MSKVESYQDLRVWKQGMQLVSVVYDLTASFPDAERYGLISQLRRAAVSVPSNVAEGWGQKTASHYIHHLRIARSSIFEIETQLMIAIRLGYIEPDVGRQVLNDTDVESRMLMSLITRLGD